MARSEDPIDNPAEHPAGFTNLRFVPKVSLGLVRSGNFEVVAAREFFAGKKAFAIGIPGAYTPICSEKHVPALIADAEMLKKRGFDMIACITSNDPFVVMRWSQDIDPESKLVFLSDGNLDFATALGMVIQEQDLLLGSRSKRYSLIIQDSTIMQLRSEKTIFDLECTSPSLELRRSGTADRIEQEFI